MCVDEAALMGTDRRHGWALIGGTDEVALIGAGTDNSWGPRAIGDHGAPVYSPTLKPHPKKPMKGTRGISWGPLLTLGQCPSAQMVSPPL
ncbi:unnamed protein product, partial [Staurois parvus]